jgi:hypothetical protein
MTESFCIIPHLLSNDHPTIRPYMLCSSLIYCKISWKAGKTQILWVATCTQETRRHEPLNSLSAHINDEKYYVQGYMRVEENTTLISKHQKFNSELFKNIVIVSLYVKHIPVYLGRFVCTDRCIYY